MTPGMDSVNWVIENTVVVPEFWVLVFAFVAGVLLASLASRPRGQ